jgi:hypothetical protein
MEKVMNLTEERLIAKDLIELSQSIIPAFSDILTIGSKKVKTKFGLKIHEDPKFGECPIAVVN